MPQLTEGVAYKLEEIKAPAGYEISTEMKDGYFFYIAKEPTEKPENVSKWNVFQSGEYIYYPNTKSDKYELPETGGIGTNRFTAVGLALMAGSLMCGYVMKAETQRKEGNLKPTSQANPRRRSVSQKYKSVKQKNVYKGK